MLLLAFGFCRWGERLSRRLARAAPAGTAETTGTARTVALSRAAVALGLPVLLSSILLFSAEGELHRALDLRIADPHRAVIALDHAPGGVRVLALDGFRMPEP